ncbi:MAG: VOC family protein [Chitinophagales bacterium]
MKNLVVYLTFAGNCEEALNFYKNALGGEIIMKQTFGESPVPSEENWKNKIMHSQFKAEGIFFMASDNMDGKPVATGANISLSIDVSDENEQTKIFSALAEGGMVTMPLEDTFWGARFGMLRDKFGIVWMLNHDKPKQQTS